ncbi:hypothetical protein JKP88DRAFT_255479 [Tribonema minus]|uniref:Uncharacterized protein n=1 Tax=Tribonema minus TaxID=303371 RepID=A0A836CG51_9STRA|nr:hypothetical protein JKP88DRAFT_255479 [Tribonema minus]
MTNKPLRRLDAIKAVGEPTLQEEHGELLRAVTVQEEARGDELRLLASIARGKAQEMHQMLNSITQSLARKYAQEQYGLPYVETLDVRSIYTLATFLTAEVGNSGYYDEDVSLEELMVMKAVETVVEEHVPERLLQCIAAKIQQSQDNPELTWFDDNDKLNQETLGKFIDGCEDNALRESLTLLRDVLIKDEEERAECIFCEDSCRKKLHRLAMHMTRAAGSKQCSSNLKEDLSSDVQKLADEVVAAAKKRRKLELMESGGAGTMCLMAAAHPSLHVNSSNKGFIVPPKKLEFNVAGRAIVAFTGQILSIDIGEIDPELSLKEAIQHMGLRLGAYKWLIITCMPNPRSDVHLVGRLFVSKCNMPEHRGDWAIVQKRQRTLAFKKWGYHLYFHIFSG